MPVVERDEWIQLTPKRVLTFAAEKPKLDAEWAMSRPFRPYLSQFLAIRGGDKEYYYHVQGDYKNIVCQVALHGYGLY